MSDDMTPLTDTRDMICVHDVFRRALVDAPEQIASVTDGATERAHAWPATSVRCPSPREHWTRGGRVGNGRLVRARAGAANRVARPLGRIIASTDSDRDKNFAL